MAGQKVRLRAVVRGIVQGVGFRFFTVDQVHRIGGIVGYVRNLRDGRVEVVAEGDWEKLEQLLKKLQEGPIGAVVDGVDASWEMATGEFTDFRIRW